MADRKETVNEPAPEASINSATLRRLPPFWKENPAAWFITVEMTFDLARITSDDTKYRYVVTNLDHTVLPFVMDVLASPPARGKYEEIKKRIIETFDESHETKLRKLLRGSEVVDEKPSHCLQRLRNLAGGQVGENVLRTLFLEQLPESMRTVLAISDTADLQRLALLADKIAEMSAPRVAAIEASTPVIPPPSTRIEALEAKVEKLVSMVETLTTRQSRQPYRSQPRWRPRGSPGRGRSGSRSTSREGNNYCFYHRRFAERAHRCVIPCGWPGPPPTGASANPATQGN
ncbi:uncharacterized protein LOC123988426 [Osmia bicornis bicornis]|uniref:uncharacterized protein LOC123988426 n=1 Tax=Osmia bicornis bicornis TaxID=1437191 RepID=UPI001EAE9F89|nr:uncharacterized protein LOC123988426 [Osmia bicornis bicornis]